MGKDTGISWCHHTFNPWWGCARVSRACNHCYAEAWAKRTGHEVWGKNAPRRMLSDDHWRGPIRWDRQAEILGQRHRVFCGSMCDVFEDRDDLIESRRRLFDLITETPNLDWLLLTKRPENILNMVPWWWHSGEAKNFAGQVCYSHQGTWPENVWVGTTVENQECADARIPHLLAVPAPVRFLSMEPLVERVDISAFLAAYTPLDGGDEVPRGDRLPARRGGAHDDRRGGSDLADELLAREPLGRPIAGHVEGAAPSGEPGRRQGIPASQGHDRGGALSRHGTSVGLAARSRSADPEGPDDQPRERGEVGQPAEQPRTGDALGAVVARSPRLGARPDGSVVDEERHGEAHARAGGGDQGTPGGGGKVGDDRGGLRDRPGNGVEDRPWGSSAAWVICGGESGGGAVRMDPDWARSVRDQCAAAGAAFHFKQTGAVLAKEWGLEAKAGDDPAEWPAEFQIREFPRSRVS